jgi:hypothetical protein
MSETLVGLILKGREDKLKQVVSSIEHNRDIEIVYVRWPRFKQPYLLIIELDKHRRRS